jgi:AraC-like DNA-binding protein
MFLADNGGTTGRPQEAHQDQRYHRLCDLVAERCTAPDFRISSLAKDLAISRSTMYDIFKSGGTTIERLGSEARVSEAMALLHSATHADQSITSPRRLALRPPQHALAYDAAKPLASAMPGMHCFSRALPRKRLMGSRRASCAAAKIGWRRRRHLAACRRSHPGRGRRQPPG